MVQPVQKLVVSYNKTNSYLRTQEAYALIFTQRNKTYPQKNRHVDVYRSFSCPTVKMWKQPTHPSVGGWINCVHPDSGTLLSTKKK